INRFQSDSGGWFARDWRDQLYSLFQKTSLWIAQTAAAHDLAQSLTRLLQQGSRGFPASLPNIARAGVMPISARDTRAKLLMPIAARKTRAKFLRLIASRGSKWTTSGYYFLRSKALLHLASDFTARMPCHARLLDSRVTAD